MKRSMFASSRRVSQQRAHPGDRPVRLSYCSSGGAAAEEICAGRMSVRRVASEDFVLQAGEEPYDIVSAVRVGALDARDWDGREPSVVRLRSQKADMPKALR